MLRRHFLKLLGLGALASTVPAAAVAPAPAPVKATPFDAIRLHHDAVVYTRAWVSEDGYTAVIFCPDHSGPLPLFWVTVMTGTADLCSVLQSACTIDDLLDRIKAARPLTTAELFVLA